MKTDNTPKVIILLIILLVIIAIDLTTSIMHIANYNDQKAWGNARWELVEERILDIEERMDKIEKEEK